MIRLAPDLSLPPDMGTQTTAIFGKRGSGKTSTATVLAEELWRAKVPFVALDVADVWWGLKAAGDGKARGLGVYVFGGRHADLPLEPTGGALMADVLVDHRISAVLSMKHFDGRDRSRFVTDFAKRLLQRNTEPLHVFLEEAHELAPENPMAAERQHEMLGAINRLWKLGRSSGIGGSAITQRPASLSKNITTQAEVLIVHRTIGPQDVAAIRAWIKYHGEREDILAQLPTLGTGEAFVWAPDFPEAKPIGLRRVRIRPRETFDSSATPKAGEKRAEPRELAAVDLDALRDRMAATIEKAQAEDPKALRARITTLERDMAAAVKAQVVPDPEALERARSEGFAAGEQAARRAIATLAAAATASRERAARALDRGREHFKLAGEAFSQADDALREPLDVPDVQVQHRPAGCAGAAQPREISRDVSPMDSRKHISGPISAPRTSGFRHPDEARAEALRDRPPRHARILVAVASLEAHFANPPRELVAAMAETGHWISTFDRDCGQLRTSGDIEYRVPGTINIPSARDARDFVQPVSEAQLHSAVLAKLPPRQRRILQMLLPLRGHDMTREDLAIAAGTRATVSTFDRDLGWLRATAGLIDYPSAGRVAAVRALFLEGR